jgi:DNA-binding beta-propeller fold protein YncE
MRKHIPSALAVVAALIVGFMIGSPRQPAGAAEGETPPTAGFAAVAGEIGEQDVSGPYAVQEGWPKDLSTLPGHEAWTWGAGQGIFAENPNRVYVLFRGELPNLKEPPVTRLPQIGPSLQFPVGGLPWRSATATALPGSGGTGQDPEQGMANWRGRTPPYRELGVDARWEHCLVVVDAQGNIVEEWTQWDKIFKRPHAVYVNPYDPQKHVWVVDDHMHAIYKFTNDGKQLVQTIGTPTMPGADATHFNRPTFMAWDPDGNFYVADGYNGTRVAKFDANGTFLLDWGEKGEAGKETRPNYMNNVHGIAVDPETRRVYVNDRANHRIQIFDQDGKYLSEWSIKVRPSSLHLLYMGQDRMLWTFDRNTQKLVKYDLEGRLQYAWGAVGDFPGTLWGVHGMSVDQEGNFYVAEVDSGRVQKFRPRPGANPDFLVGKPVYAAWN